MPIKAETTITKKICKDAYKYSLLKKRSVLVVIVISLVLVASAAYMYIAVVPMLLWALLLPILGVLLNSILPVLIYSVRVSRIKTQYFTFEEDYFTIRSEPDGEAGLSEIEYSSLYQIHETKHHFYLYYLNQQFFIISKEHIENATPEQLRQLFQASLPNQKYKRYKV
jgi:hypothetical protein